MRSRAQGSSFSSPSPPQARGLDHGGRLPPGGCLWTSSEIERRSPEVYAVIRGGLARPVR